MFKKVITFALVFAFVVNAMAFDVFNYKFFSTVFPKVNAYVLETLDGVTLDEFDSMLADHYSTLDSDFGFDGSFYPADMQEVRDFVSLSLMKFEDNDTIEVIADKLDNSSISSFLTKVNNVRGKFPKLIAYAYMVNKVADRMQKDPSFAEAILPHLLSTQDYTKLTSWEKDRGIFIRTTIQDMVRYINEDVSVPQSFMKTQMYNELGALADKDFWTWKYWDAYNTVKTLRKHKCGEGIDYDTSRYYSRLHFDEYYQNYVVLISPDFPKTWGNIHQAYMLASDLRYNGDFYGLVANMVDTRHEHHWRQGHHVMKYVFVNFIHYNYMMRNTDKIYIQDSAVSKIVDAETKKAAYEYDDAVDAANVWWSSWF